MPSSEDTKWYVQPVNDIVRDMLTDEKSAGFFEEIGWKDTDEGKMFLYLCLPGYTAVIHLAACKSGSPSMRYLVYRQIGEDGPIENWATIQERIKKEAIRGAIK